MANISRKEMLQEQIISVSSILFLEKGIDAVKMTDIAENCQVGVASIYRYFGTKTNLVIRAGALLWKDLEKVFHDKFTSDEYKAKSGYEQMKQLLSIYMELYENYRSFLKFTNDFDALMLSEHILPKELEQYEQSIFDLYPVAREAFEKGCLDHSIRNGCDFSLIYLTFTHSATSLCQKMIRGKILPSDDFSAGDKELQNLIDMTLYFMH